MIKKLLIALSLIKRTGMKRVYMFPILRVDMKNANKYWETIHYGDPISTPDLNYSSVHGLVQRQINRNVMLPVLNNIR